VRRKPRCAAQAKVTIETGIPPPEILAQPKMHSVLTVAFRHRPPEARQ
jgi:hypothetical protein